MKGIIVKEKIPEGPSIDMTRVIIPEKNLAVTLWDGELHVDLDFEMDDSCTVLGEIDLTDEQIAMAIAFKAAHKAANECFLPIFDNLKNE